MLLDSIDVCFKDIRQTFKSEMEVYMGIIFNCICPCRFGSNIPYYPSVQRATNLIHNCRTNMHGATSLELKKSVFMLPFCLQLWERLMNLRNIKMEKHKVTLVSKRESTLVIENLCGCNNQETLGTVKPAVQ